MRTALRIPRVCVQCGIEFLALPGCAFLDLVRLEAA